MANNTPNWITILLGGSGVLGLVTIVTKGIVDQKDEHIRYLTRINQDLERKVEDERKKSTRLIDNFAEQLQKIDAGQWKPEDALHLKEIFNLIDNFETLPEGFNDCKKAAKYLEIHKIDWVRKAVRNTRAEYRELISWNKEGKFKEDLTRYLTWVSTCLDKYGHTFNSPLSDYVSLPVISSPHPYVAAIGYIISQGEWGELNSAQAAYLKEVLIQLQEKIQQAFQD